VGVITLPRLSASLGAEGMWIMGGMLGLVGLGRVRLSLNTARLALSRGGLKGSGSIFSLAERIEDWDTPVLGALAIRLAALGVAFCRMGLLITGLAAVGGLEDCILSEVGDKAGLSDDGDEEEGEDMVTESLTDVSGLMEEDDKDAG